MNAGRGPRSDTDSSIHTYVRLNRSALARARTPASPMALFCTSSTRSDLLTRMALASEDAPDAHSALFDRIRIDSELQAPGV